MMHVEMPTKWLLCLALCMSGFVLAQSGLDVPRFVSVKAKEANIRKGPGRNFPIKWVLVRPYLPVEIVDEHQDWRKIRDIQGDEGWVHRVMLSGKRSVIVAHGEPLLHKTQKPDSRVVARLERGVIAILDTCNATHCAISIKGLEGWVQRSSLYGVYEDDVF